MNFFKNSKMSDPLTSAICTRILEYLGLLPYSHFGQQGLSIPRFCLPKVEHIAVESDVGESQLLPLYTAQTCLEDKLLHLMFLNSSIPLEEKYSYIEFLLLFNLDDLPTHCLYYQNDPSNGILASLIAYQTDQKIWLPLRARDQALLLVGFDTLFSLGAGWEPGGDCATLRTHLPELLREIME